MFAMRVAARLSPCDVECPTVGINVITCLFRYSEFTPKGTNATEARCIGQLGSDWDPNSAYICTQYGKKAPTPDRAGGIARLRVCIPVTHCESCDPADLNPQAALIGHQPEYHSIRDVELREVRTIRPAHQCRLLDFARFCRVIQVGLKLPDHPSAQAVAVASCLTLNDPRPFGEETTLNRHGNGPILHSAAFDHSLRLKAGCGALYKCRSCRIVQPPLRVTTPLQPTRPVDRIGLVSAESISSGNSQLTVH